MFCGIGILAIMVDASGSDSGGDVAKPKITIRLYVVSLKAKMGLGSLNFQQVRNEILNFVIGVQYCFYCFCTLLSQPINPFAFIP